MTQAPIAPGLFRDTGDGPRLVASRCAHCSPAVVTFPTQPDCPRCAGDEMEEILLPRRGTLWTFTTQEFIPKSPPYAIVETPESFQPFAVGYVEFDGLLKVEGRLTESDAAKLAIGMDMEVVTIPFRTDDGGREIVTYAFRPAGSEAEPIGEDSNKHRAYFGDEGAEMKIGLRGLGSYPRNV